MLSFTMAHVRGGRAAAEAARRRAALARARARCGSAGASCRCSPLLGGLGTGDRVRGGHGARRARADLGRGLAGARGRRATCSTAATRACRSPRPRKVVMPKPIVEHEVEYESVLVAFEDGALLAREPWPRPRSWPPGAGAASTCWCTITVPANAPIDADDARAGGEGAARSIDSARVRGGRRVTGHWEKVRAGRGRAADRRGGARDPGARAIVMTLPPKRTGASLFGRTLETVLAERPCRVIIDSPPARSSAGRGAPPERATITARGSRLAGLDARASSAAARARGRGDGGRARWRAAAGRWRSAWCSGRCSRCSARAGCGSRAAGRGEDAAGDGRAPAAARPARAGCARLGGGRGADRARPRRAGAVRDRAERGRLVDLLRARASWPATRSGSRPLVFLLAGAVLRAHDAHLRRGQLAAPRARRRVDLRPLRLQRAVELHRRLGDPPRLPDRDGDRARWRCRTTWPRSGGRPATRASRWLIIARRDRPSWRGATSAASRRSGCGCVLRLSLLNVRARRW